MIAGRFRKCERCGGLFEADKRSRSPFDDSFHCPGCREIVNRLRQKVRRDMATKKGWSGRVLRALKAKRVNMRL